jgi:hypothetical protein
LHTAALNSSTSLASSFDFDGPRTNNYVEGWHSRLKKVVGKPHPNIFELIKVMKKEEATTKMKAAAV